MLKANILHNKNTYNLRNNKKIYLHNRNNRVITTKLSDHDIVYGSYLVGKGIILYTMFYCSLNWLYYREQRKKIEKEDEKDNNKK